MSIGLSGRRKPRKLKAEINVVPYIDVMLVLLIIFMVTAPMLTLSVDVNLPDSTARSLDSKKDPVIVTMTKEGGYMLTLEGGRAEPIVATELSTKLRAFVSQNKGVAVMLAAPKEASYQSVMDTMVVLQQAGVPNVGLMSQPPERNAR